MHEQYIVIISTKIIHQTNGKQKAPCQNIEGWSFRTNDIWLCRSIVLYGLFLFFFFLVCSQINNKFRLEVSKNCIFHNTTIQPTEKFQSGHVASRLLLLPEAIDCFGCDELFDHPFEYNRQKPTSTVPNRIVGHSFEVQMGVRFRTKKKKSIIIRLLWQTRRVFSATGYQKFTLRTLKLHRYNIRSGSARRRDLSYRTNSPDRSLYDSELNDLEKYVLHLKMRRFGDSPRTHVPEMASVDE